IPALDLLLELYRQANVVMDFIPNQNVHAVAPCESRHESISVLECAPRKIVCDAGVERSVAPAGENVDVVGARHSESLVAPLKLGRKIWLPFLRIACFARNARRG